MQDKLRAISEMKKDYNEDLEKSKKESSSSLRLIALILAINLGCLGAHRFYVGKCFTAILYVLTAGFFGFGVLFDIVKIVKGSFKDCLGKSLINWLN